MKTKYIPVFALAVKTDLHAQQQAQQFGFSAIITKPIDYEELETKVAKAINLDTSERYFVFEQDYLLIRLPESTSTSAVNEISAYLKPKIAEAVDQGYSRVIFDVHSVRNVNMALIKLLVDSMQICIELTLSYGLVGNPQIVQECRGFEESKDWKFHDSIDAAKATL
jgi:two-component system cell cycle response regulator